MSIDLGGGEGGCLRRNKCQLGQEVRRSLTGLVVLCCPLHRPAVIKQYLRGKTSKRELTLEDVQIKARDGTQRSCTVKLSEIKVSTQKLFLVLLTGAHNTFLLVRQRMPLA
jgi:hypothetical protein